MSTDHTQNQDEDQQRQSKELSRQRSRPPIELEGYDARQFLGAGAYGEVWVAVDRNTGRKVAIKFYTQKSGVDWSLLSREVEKLVFLSADRYVVQLLDVGWDSDPPFYVMEYVEGGSLQDLLDREGPLPVGEAVEMFREIVTGLLHAHGKGVLHCDLKPANILLDQDRKPRLADFGQSRLSHEQRPALGTLFFMAPEQADLNAVPDARWDVYALGALLFCMLTGDSPYRSEKLLSAIDTSPTLVGRLEKYREEIRCAPVPSKHRQMANVDRELADIVDRCLAVEPSSRFPNVQRVQTSLRARDSIRDRKPLLLLGLLGPLVFLTALGLFGGSAYRTSINDSENMLRQWTYESSRWTAKAVAVAVARRIDQYFRLVEEQAGDSDLQYMIEELTDPQSETGRLLMRLTDQSLPDHKETVAEFVSHPSRAALNARIDRLIGAPEDSVASWFITNDKGIQLASSIRNEVSSTLGLDFSRRAYFHGDGDDRAKGKHYNLPPLSRTQLSPVFRSEASGTWKIAISTPVVKDGLTIGVIALTVELGQLGNDDLIAASKDRFVAIVDGRKEHRGQILQHPLFNEVLKQQDKLPDYSEYKVNLDDLPASDEKVDTIQMYRDPLAKADGGERYTRDWIAAQHPVPLDVERQRDRNGSDSNNAGETGLIVLVQEDYDSASAPVRNLGRDLVRDGFLALLLIVSSVLGLWYWVARALKDPNEAARRAGGGVVPPSSLNSMETLELPERARGRSGPKT